MLSLDERWYAHSPISILQSLGSCAVLRWAVVVMLPMSPAPAVAWEGMEKRIGAHLGRLFFEDQADQGSDVREGDLMGASVGLRARQWGLELSAARISAHHRLDRFTTVTIQGLSIGFHDDISSELEITTVRVTGRYYFSGALERFQPYVGVGGGYHYLRVSDARDFSASGATAVGVDIENTLGMHVNLGTEIMLSQSWLIGLDGNYVIADAHLSYQSTFGRELPLTLDIGGLALAAHFKYRLP